MKIHVLILITNALRAVAEEIEEMYCNIVLEVNNFDPFGWNPMHCQLHRYDVQDVAGCLDLLVSNFNFIDQPLRFLFVGDSRMRLIFHSFWPMLPNYDLQIEGEGVTRMLSGVHKDMDIESAILGVRVSFRWRPRIDDVLLTQMKRWAANSNHTPSYLFLGFSGHHMDKPGDYKVYTKQLRKLAAILKTVRNRARVFWLHQNPIMETYANKNHGNAIKRSSTQMKYDYYNFIARRTLSGINIIDWSSSYRIAEEYVRGCALMDRSDVKNFHSCSDFIHTGYVVNDRGSQILLNSFCNKLLSNNSYPSFVPLPGTCCVP